MRDLSLLPSAEEVKSPLFPHPIILYIVIYATVVICIAVMLAGPTVPDTVQTHGEGQPLPHKIYTDEWKNYYLCVTEV